MKRFLRRAAFGLVPATLAALVLGVPAAADPDSNDSTQGLTSPALLALITDDDVFATADLALLLSTPGANATQHYGPYPSTSPDSGTCGTWATDTFDRHFTVKSNHDGTFTVVQQFKKGSFETDAGPSPGTCDTTDGSPPGTVDGGVTGSMHGYFVIPLPPGTMQMSTDPSCAPGPPCTTAGFINSHFTPCYPATCPVTTFAFHYSAGDQGLVEHEWKNASADRGGNHGDIRSTNVP
jgi:hypothetical protein